MSMPGLYFSTCCCHEKAEHFAEKELVFGLQAVYVLALTDALCALTSLVIGILSACSVISMAPALMGSLIGLSVLISVLWIAMVVDSSVNKDSD